MWWYWPFDDRSREAVAGAGLDWRAISQIFFQSERSVKAPLNRHASLAGLYNFIETNYRAGETSFETLRRKEMTLPDPWGGSEPIAMSGGALSNFTKGALYVNPLIYRGVTNEREFYAISYELTGRITLLIFPDLQAVLFVNNLDHAKTMTMLFEANLATVAPLLKERKTEKVRIVGVIDMVFNYGHQMMNHLSGLERLVGEGLQESLSEIWISGPSFFGEIAELYPEVATKLRHFRTKEEVLKFIQAENVLPVRIGSNVFTYGLRRRLLDRAAVDSVYPRDHKHFPLVALTIRSHGRACLNLPGVVARLHTLLSARFPNVGYVLDGWVFPERTIRLASESATCIDSGHREQIARELAAAEAVANVLPKGAVVRNLIGRSILNSIAGQCDVDAYFGHVGTLQHKLGFLTHARGLVHGPKRQMTYFDTGSFSSESGLRPKFVDPACIEDVEGSGGGRGENFADYRIADIDKALEPFLAMFEG